jgi:hypothetical protein
MPHQIAITEFRKHLVRIISALHSQILRARCCAHMKLGPMRNNPPVPQSANSVRYLLFAISPKLSYPIEQLLLARRPV